VECFRKVQCFLGKNGVNLDRWSVYGERLEWILKCGVHFEKEWSEFRNVECIRGKSGVYLEMWSVFWERVE